MKRFASFLLISLVFTATSFADKLVSGTKTHTGTFEGFNKNIFEFKVKGGKTLKFNKTKVKSLTLSKPLKVSYMQRGKEQVDNVNFVSYEKFKFNFIVKGKPKKINGITMKNITKSWSNYSAGSGRSGEQPRPMQALDLSGINRENLNDSDKAIVAEYDDALAAYNQFINESSKMVRQMDSATGQARENLLNKLRTRKQDEQPVRKRLEEAEAAVLKAFPAE